MKMITTFTKTLLVYFMFLTGTMLSAQTVTVSSNLNSGTGTLRQLIADAAPNDSIVIPENYTIVLSSEIAFSKNLKINGQGSIVQVTVPGVSNWRVFTVGTTASTATTVSMYNLNLQGGYLTTAFGATVWVARNHTFTMKNCTVSKGKATYTGGIFCDNVIGTTMNIQDCTFSENESTTANGGACILKGIITISNCTFSNNKATMNGAAIACYNGALISNCKFISNSSNGITGGAVINYSPLATEPVNLENCTFESNTHTTGATGAGAFVIASANAASTLTNCTFYKNTGQSAGAVYNSLGTLKIVNCTFSGNSTPTTNGGAFLNANAANAKTTLVNCIFAYNYNSAGLKDVYKNTTGTVDGRNNIVGTVTGSPTYTNPISFSYSPASDLFDSYTTTGTLMPILADNGSSTKTIALSNTSIAKGVGVSTFGTPNIVPLCDQRGVLHATTPCIGAYESTDVMAQNYYVKPASTGSGNGLSWTEATTLNHALSMSASGDVIHIAAGTYTPNLLLTGGATGADKTFEISKNISLIGGYSASPTDGEIPSSANITKFDGTLTCNHVITVSAQVVPDKKVSLSNISVTGGISGATTGSVTIYPRTKGGAMIIGASTVELNNCRIYGNQGSSIPGAYIFGSANVVFNSCTIENNIGSGNGGGIWNEVSTVYLNNSSVSNNTTTGVGAGVYAINSLASTTTDIPKTYIFNTTINNNTASNNAGYYGREKSVGVMVNCTVYGNASSNTTANTGGGISLYANLAANAVRLDIINSTITNNNSSVATADDGGGIRVNDQYCSLNIYNSIVSGNTVGVGDTQRSGDIALLSSATYSKTNTIISDKVYDASGAEVAGKTFDFATMLEALDVNGGATKIFKLLLAEDVNPAKTLGMSSAELTILGGSLTPVIPESIITYDQLHNFRAGRVIGAWTANGMSTNVIINNEFQKPIVYSEGNSIYIQTKSNDKISVYAVTGQRIHVTNAINNTTKINNLVKGTIYIVNVNGKNTKIVL